MQKKGSWKNVGKVIFITWCAITLIIYIYFPGAISQTHDATLHGFSTLAGKLSRISPYRFLVGILLAVTGIGIYATSCVSLGMRVSGIFHLERMSDNDNSPWRDALIPTYLLVGNVIYSVVFLTLATTFTLNTSLSALILIIGFLAGMEKFKKLTIPKPRIGEGYGKFLSISMLIVLVVSIFHSSARISYDASAIYFSAAKLTAFKNHATFYLEHSFPASNLHSVIQSSAILQIFGDQAARMVSWLFGTVIIGFALALAKFGRVSPMAIRILPVLILTSTAFLDQMGDGKVDLLGTAYSLAGVYWIAVGAKDNDSSQNQRPFLLAGIFIGFSSILRPYNAILLGVYITVYLSQKLKPTRQSLINIGRHVLWMGCGAIGFAIYHLYINKVILNDALAFLNALTAINPTDGPWDYNPESEWVNKLLYPFVVTFKNSGASLGNITPLVVAFLPALALSDIRKNTKLSAKVSRLVISAGTALLIWVLLIFTVVEVRYVMFLWILLYLPVAEIIATGINTNNLMIKGLTVCSIFFLVSFIIIRSLYISFSTYSPINSQKNPTCFDTDDCLIINAINDTAGEGARVLTLSGLRYYLRNDLFVCSTDHEEFKIFQTLDPENEEIFWLEVYRRGYQYIAFEEGYVTDSALLKIVPGPNNTPSWITLEPIFGKPGDKKIAYRILVNEPPLDIEWTCRQNNSTKKWEVIQESP